MSKPLRWGIASCGKISSDFVNAVQHLGEDNHVVQAVAARNLKAAKEFAAKFGVETSYDLYDALAKDPKVDVVYVGAINVSHYSISKAALSAGKPVLCEKPLCMSLKETEELLQIAKDNNVFLMEAMWARCNPAYLELKKRIANKDIGEVTHVNVTFGISIAAINREYTRGLGWGCLLDFGIYPMNVILLAMGDEKPLSIKSHGKLNDEGQDIEVSGSLEFSGGRFATFHLSATSVMPNEAVIIGTKGVLKLESLFWCTTKLTGPPADFSFELEPSERVYNFDNSQLLKNEAIEVAKCLREGKKESSLVPHSLTMKFAEILQEVRDQIGAQA